MALACPSWGTPGMLVAIPLIAIAKLIFDHIESLKPLSFLLVMPCLLRYYLNLPQKRKTSEVLLFGLVGTNRRICVNDVNLILNCVTTPAAA